MAAERLIVPAFYLFWVLLALALALAARRPALVWLGVICLINWFAHNVIIEKVGAVHSPLLLPEKDALMASLVALVFARYRSPVAVIVGALFVVIGIIHFDASLTHTQGTYSYLLALNLLFACMVIAIGGTSGWALADWRHSRGLVARAHPGSVFLDVGKR